MRIGVFLQARLESTRLPRKALLPLGDSSVVEQAMASLARVPADVHALLTDKTGGRELGPRAQRCGFQVFVGDPEDVLCRFADAVRFFQVDLLVRATGDNPLVSWELAGMAIERAGTSDYTGFLGSPLGTGVEVIRASALLRADAEARERYDREHVAPYLYHNPDLFAVNRMPVPVELELPEARVTLDTLEDFEFITRIYRDLYRGRPISVRSLVEWLRDDIASRQFRQEPALRL